MEMYERLRERYSETEQYKSRWLALYQELYFYVLPNRDAFNEVFGYSDTGKPNTVQIWDNTAVLCAYERANDLHGLLMPQDRVWGSLSMDKRLFSDELIEANKVIMDEINDRVFFYLNESNLARSVSSSNLDLVGGTGALWVESIDDYTPLYFRSIPSVALYIEYSNDDVLNTCWYKIRMTARSIRENFPKYKGMHHASLLENPNEIHTVIYGQIKMPDNKFHIYAVLDSDPFVPLFEYERNYQQIIIYRDRVRPGEAEGRGIGLDLLPTIRDLNHMVSDRRKNLAFKANPPMFYDADSYFNPYSVRQWSQAFIPRNPGGRNPIEALQMPEYVDVDRAILDAREEIRRGFNVDPLGEINTPVRSASEVSIRENRAQRSSATDISRLINELPRQVYEVATRILSERNLLTKDRAARINLNSKRFKFDFKSPLYDLQKQDNLNHFQGNLQMKQQYLGQGAAIATLNLPKVNSFLTENFNLPNDLFKTEQEIQAYINKAADMAQSGQLPTPTTTAAPARIPEQTQVQI